MCGANAQQSLAALKFSKAPGGIHLSPDHHKKTSFLIVSYKQRSYSLSQALIQSLLKSTEKVTVEQKKVRECAVWLPGV